MTRSKLLHEDFAEVQHVFQKLSFHARTFKNSFKGGLSQPPMIFLIPFLSRKSEQGCARNLETIVSGRASNCSKKGRAVAEWSQALLSGEYKRKSKSGLPPRPAQPFNFLKKFKTHTTLRVESMISMTRFITFGNHKFYKLFLTASALNEKLESLIILLILVELFATLV